MLSAELAVTLGMALGAVIGVLLTLRRRRREGRHREWEQLGRADDQA
jgi:hypothetical protein